MYLFAAIDAFELFENTSVATLHTAVISVIVTWSPVAAAMNKAMYFAHFGISTEE